MVSDDDATTEGAVWRERRLADPMNYPSAAPPASAQPARLLGLPYPAPVGLRWGLSVTAVAPRVPFTAELRLATMSH